MAASTSIPYIKPMKVKVVALGTPRDFTSSKGEQKQFMQLGLATPEKALRAFHYDPSKIRHITEDSYVIIKNFVTRQDGNITLNSSSLMYLTSPFTVPPTVEDSARHLIHPPEAELVDIKTAASSPTKSTVSIKGIVTQDESPRQVTVGGGPAAVRGLTMEDNSGKIKVSLWRDKSTSSVQLGDYVQMTNLAMTKFNNEVTAGSTSRTTIEIMEPPVVRKSVNIEGYMPTEDGYQLVSAADGTFNINIDRLQSHLQIDEEDIITQLAALLPWHIDIHIKGMDIISFNTA